VPYLKLIDAATHRATEIREATARLGRSPACAVVLDDDAGVAGFALSVPAKHAVAIMPIALRDKLGIQ
jgi:hypothetical protein